MHVYISEPNHMDIHYNHIMLINLTIQLSANLIGIILFSVHAGNASLVMLCVYIRIYMCACVCARARVCVCEHARAHVCVCACAYACG